MEAVLSRLMWIQEGLKWWQPFDFQALPNLSTAETESCEAQRDGIRAGATKAKTEALGTVALSDVLVVSKDMISRSVGAVSSLSVARLCYTKSVSATQLGYFLVDF